MKNIIKSWRWSRLNSLSTIKTKLTQNSFEIVILISLLLLLFSISTVLYFAVATLIILFIVIACLYVICTSDDYFELENSLSEKIKIYVYKKDSYYEIHIGNTYAIRAIDYKKSNSKKSFIYCQKYDKKWWIYNVDTVRFIELGKHLCYDSVFTNVKNNKNVSQNVDAINLFILTTEKSECINMNCEKVYTNDDIFIPDAKKYNLPNKLLFVKANGKYKLYGLFSPNEDDIFITVSEYKVDSIIINEGAINKVVLLLDEKNDSYKQFYCGSNYCNIANDTFIEATEYYTKVLRFNAQKQEVEVVYKGQISSIDFDSGEICGINGVI